MIRSNKNENHTIGTELRYNQYKTEMLCFPNRSKNRTKPYEKVPRMPSITNRNRMGCKPSLSYDSYHYQYRKQ